jgi:nucleoside-diphosphate-sugar epimerase
MNKMKIFITGGSGFIGTNLIELLIQNQINFINFDKAEPINPSHRDYWEKGNLLDKKVLLRSIKKYHPSIIIHLAARTDCDSNKLEEYKDNTEGTQNLVNCINQFNFIERVIITSTQYVYKSQSHPFQLTDDDYKPHTTYGESKVITEKITRNANLNCCWTIVRPTNVWGPWHMRYPNELWKMIDKGFYMHPGKKEVIRTYAYVKNVVHQINAILESPCDKVNKRTFYLGDLPVDSFEWLNRLSLELKNKKIQRIPIFIFAIPAAIGTVIRKLGIPFPLYNTRFNNMIEDYYAPTNITINQLGLYNSDMDNNIKETVDWLKNEGIKYFPYWNNKYKK